MVPLIFLFVFNFYFLLEEKTVNLSEPILGVNTP